ncbi:MAG: rod shape-determining protein MreC [Chloroflexi bacterium]|nr:rod shape-determining protein MreC [Chloroflexota bacterium]
MQLLRPRPLGILVVILGAVVIMLLDAAGFMTPVNGVIHDAARPFATALTELRVGVSDVVNTARDLRTLRRRNAELEALVERLTVENLQLSEIATENEQLRRFFEFAQANPTYDLRGGQIIARVIGGRANPLVAALDIDLGREHGIEQGMPVVTDRGLVGRVSEVYPQSSEILLLTDSTSAINVMTQASRAPGVLRGRTGKLPLMDYIPPDVEVSPGEIVITSGLGRDFPKGLVVGQVVQVLQNDNRPFQQAVVRPTVNFNRLELVLIVTNFLPESELDETAENGDESLAAPAADTTP